MTTPSTSTPSSTSSGSGSSSTTDTATLDKAASDSALGRNTSQNTSNTDGLTVNQDTFENPDRTALGNLLTSVDPAGIERIVQPLPLGWEPAPVSATDEQKAAAKAHEAYLEKAKGEREKLWGSQADINSGPKAPNNPGDGGSATKAP